MSVITIIVLVQTALILIATLMILTPPLDTPDEGTANYVRARKFSEPAMMGMMQFGDHCATCHGQAAEGTAEAPALIDRPYATDFRNAKNFHSELGRSIPAHADVLAAVNGGGRIDFNALERMSKYLRELRKDRLLNPD